MPVVKITMGPVEANIKKKMIKDVTKTLSKTADIPEQAFTVIIDEHSYDNIGIGGIQASEKMK